ncbi:FG-GAP-like repeat-containing protein [Nonomuraea fuscirosea]|uniref:FG-GAP-like repeat-containing protein n=2 Tax=Nonomuraea fuscirosea TaxID=1291556 RepID=UPI00340CB620
MGRRLGMAHLRTLAVGMSTALVTVSAAVHGPAPAVADARQAVAAQPGGLSAYDKLVLSHKPVAYWRLSHPSHGTETDWSGNAYKGTFHNVSSSVQLPNRDGAAAFNGSSGYFEVPDSGKFHISTTGKFTVEAWIRPHTLQFPNEEQTGYVYFLGKGTKSKKGGDQEWAGRMYSKVTDDNRPNRISGYAWNLDGGYGAGAGFQESVRVNEWIHVAFTFDTSEGEYGMVRIYRDGVLKSSSQLVYRPGKPDEVIVKPRPGPAPVRVGTRSKESWFKGAVGKFALYNRALTGKELATHYAAMTAANTPDFNADGVGDIFSTKTGSLNVWTGKGANDFWGRTHVGGDWTAYNRPVAGDFDGDGRTDLLATDKTTGLLYVWNGQGGNTFTDPVRAGSGWLPYGDTLTSVGDINGDGHTDIAAVSGNTLYAWNGKGGNTFGARATIGPGWKNYTRPIGGDFNGDGIGDLAAVEKATGDLCIWNGEGGNEFATRLKTGPGWLPYANTLMSLGDVNRDGHTDIAAVSNDTMHLWNGKGGNRFESRKALDPGWTPYF